jgi:hypothetical protein
MFSHVASREGATADESDDRPFWGNLNTRHVEAPIAKYARHLNGIGVCGARKQRFKNRRHRNSVAEQSPQICEARALSPIAGAR